MSKQSKSEAREAMASRRAAERQERSERNTPRRSTRKKTTRKAAIAKEEESELKPENKTERNAPDQTVHDVQAEAHHGHDESTERDVDDAHLDEGQHLNEATEWIRPSDLDAPEPRPGYVNRYIRVRAGPEEDDRNFAKAIREGWRPVQADTVPGQSLPTIHRGGYGNVIGVEDLILCEMPVAVHAQRAAHYAEQQGKQDAAIDRDLHAINQSRDGTEVFGPIRTTGTKTRVEVPPVKPLIKGDQGVAPDE